MSAFQRTFFTAENKIETQALFNAFILILYGKWRKLFNTRTAKNIGEGCVGIVRDNLAIAMPGESV